MRVSMNLSFIVSKENVSNSISSLLHMVPTRKSSIRDESLCFENSYLWAFAASLKFRIHPSNFAQRKCVTPCNCRDIFVALPWERQRVTLCLSNSRWNLMTDILWMRLVFYLVKYLWQSWFQFWISCRAVKFFYIWYILLCDKVTYFCYNFFLFCNRDKSFISSWIKRIYYIKEL